MYKQNKTNSDKVNQIDENDVKQTGSPGLRKRLPRGAVQLIAEEFGVSWMWTFNVINGKVKGDPRIIAMAIEYARAEDERRNMLSGLIERNRKELQKIS
jgi:hypothetical protein